MRSLARWTTCATATRKRSKATARATTSKLPTEIMDWSSRRTSGLSLAALISTSIVPRVGVGVVAGAVGLRDAPEGERVLQVSRGPGPPQITPGEELPQPVRRPRLARVGPHPGRLGVHRREVDRKSVV